MSTENREVIFLSHANPEDNEFTSWLARRLADCGYSVWADVAKLHGGEVWWDDIEDLIRNHTIKFLLILTRSSNHKGGVRQELHVANVVSRKLKRFVVPLMLDDLPYSDMNIEVGRLNAVRFKGNWATGLGHLLELLEEDGVPKPFEAMRNRVPSDVLSHIQSSVTVSDEPSVLLSNLFPARIPKAFAVEYEGACDARRLYGMSIPVAEHSKRLVSFRDPEEIHRATGMRLSNPALVDLTRREDLPPWLTNQNASLALSYLLKRELDSMLDSSGLLSHDLSGKARAYYFRNGFTKNNVHSTTDVGGFKRRRNLVGYSKKHQRYWHFAISTGVRRMGRWMYVIRPHVLFSDDGTVIWDDKAKLHRTRRSECKSWWNQHWRDRVRLAINFVAGGRRVLPIPVRQGVSINVDTRGLLLEVPVSYEIDGRSKRYTHAEEE